MDDEDISKTAFQTHHGHFEFRVMSFGLCNTSFSFQAMMNSIFKPYLRVLFLCFLTIYWSTIPLLRSMSCIWKRHSKCSRKDDSFWNYPNVHLVSNRWSILVTWFLHRGSNQSMLRWKQYNNGLPQIHSRLYATFWDLRGSMAASSATMLP